MNMVLHWGKMEKDKHAYWPHNAIMNYCFTTNIASKIVLTKYFRSLKRAWSVRMTASSVNGPCRWIKSSMSLAKILCGLVTVLLGDMIRACGFVMISLATISGGTRRRLPPFPLTSVKIRNRNYFSEFMLLLKVIIHPFHNIFAILNRLRLFHKLFMSCRWILNYHDFFLWYGAVMGEVLRYFWAKLLGRNWFHAAK